MCTCVGYTNAIDWWSLGATMFVLLTGAKPYPLLSFSTVLSFVARLQTDPQINNGTLEILNNINQVHQLPSEYLYIYDKLGAGHCYASTIHFILRLLDMNEYTRLGAPTMGGAEELMRHEFFIWGVSPATNHPEALKICRTRSDVAFSSSMSSPVKNHQFQSKNLRLAMDKDIQSQVKHKYTQDDIEYYMTDLTSATSVADLQHPHDKTPCQVEYCWDLLAQKLLVPPYLPDSKEVEENPKYMNFPTMMVELDKTAWLLQTPPASYDEWFMNWY